MSGNQLARLISTLILVFLISSGTSLGAVHAAGRAAAAGLHLESPTEDPPVAVDDTDSTPEDKAKDTAVTLNDTLDANDTYELNVTGTPEHGTAVPKTGLLVTYTPDPNFNGTDNYQYEICSNGDGGCSEATVTFTVTSVNDPPAAVDDFFPMNQSDPMTIDVLDNDSDPDGDALSAILDAQPTHGSVVLNNDSTFTYTPQADFNGLDSFLYHATDGKTGSNQAEVVIDVTQPDVEQPTLTWVAPVSDTEVYNVTGGIIVLEVQANDNQSVDYVEYRRWDASSQMYINLGTASAPPYLVELDASTLNVSWNQINARAVDTSGNASAEVYIWLVKSMALYLPVARR